MAYQFVHIQTYCPKLTKVAGTEDQYNNTDQIFGEAVRAPRYSDHLVNPQAPIPLMAYGAIDVEALHELHDTRRASIRVTVEKQGGGTYSRALKSDHPTLYTEIHSHPMASAEYPTASPEDKARVKLWARRALQDFRNRMPEGVEFAAMLHLDEGHVHIHILAVNMMDAKMSANNLHVGKIAAEEYRRAHGRSPTIAGLPKPEPKKAPNKPKKPKPTKNRATKIRNDTAYAAALRTWKAECDRVIEANASAVAAWKVANDAHLLEERKKRSAKTADVEAYQHAMTEFQSRYYDAVGRPCGLLRNGPGNERLSTKQYDERKQHARRMAQIDDAQRQAAEALEDDRRKQTKDEKDQRLHAERMRAAAQRIQEKTTAVAAQATELVRREVEVTAREKEVYERGHKQDRIRAVLTDRHEKLEAVQRKIVERQERLDAREKMLDEREQEMSQAVDAIDDLVRQVETGEFAVHDGKSHLKQMPRFIHRLLQTKAEERSPVQHLVGKLVGLLVRVIGTAGGGSVIRPENPPERPQM